MSNNVRSKLISYRREDKMPSLWCVPCRGWLDTELCNRYDCQLYLALFSDTMRSRAPVVSTETIPDHLGDESVLVSKTINTRFFLVLRPQKFPLTNQEGTTVNFLPQVLHGCTFSQLFCKPCLCCGNEPLPRPGT